MSTIYRINEMFMSLQGEGLRSGTLNVFVRFADCNLECKEDGSAGFDCDTEFSSGTDMTADEIQQGITDLWPGRPASDIILTGGEPLLQVDASLLDHLLPNNTIHIETNGTKALPDGYEDFVWVACSPKTAEHTLRIGTVDELRYVRNWSQAMPKPALVVREHGGMFLSPAWSDDTYTRQMNLQHCFSLVKQDTRWRVSTQMHKIWRLP